MSATLIRWDRIRAGLHISSRYRVRALDRWEGRGRSSDKYASEVYAELAGWQRLALHPTIGGAKERCERYEAARLRNAPLIQAPEPSPPRTYLVGLPVVVTVHDDGTVTFDVCTEDAGGAIADEGAPPEDITAVEAHLAKRATS